MKTMNRLVAALCALTLMLAMVPSAFACAPGPDDLWGCSEDILYPKYYNWLNDYETKYLKTKHGVRAYLRYAPSADSDYFAYVYEAAKVTVLARENGCSLITTADGMAGWVTSSLLVDHYPGHESSSTYSGNSWSSNSSSSPGYEDLKGCNEGLVYPDWYNWLDSYETKYLKTKHGVRAYMRYGPSADSDYFGYVYEAAKVTVLARQNGFSLVKTTDGTAGWVTSSLLVNRY